MDALTKGCFLNISVSGVSSLAKSFKQDPCSSAEQSNLLTFVSLSKHRRRRMSVFEDRPGLFVLLVRILNLRWGWRALRLGVVASCRQNTILYGKEGKLTRRDKQRHTCGQRYMETEKQQVKDRQADIHVCMYLYVCICVSVCMYLDVGLFMFVFVDLFPLVDNEQVVHLHFTISCISHCISITNSCSSRRPCIIEDRTWQTRTTAQSRTQYQKGLCLSVCLSLYI